MEPNGYQFPQIVISSGERQVWSDGALAGGPHHYSGRWSSGCFGFTWELVGSAKCCGGFRQFTLARRMA